MPDAALTDAASLFDAGRYFEAHEAFEAIWRRAADDERSLWKGVTQVAVGLLHLERANLHGARRLLERAATNLAGLDSPSAGVDVAGLRALVHRTRRAIDARGAEAAGSRPRFPTAELQASG